jgi:hypothetical protein
LATVTWTVRPGQRTWAIVTFSGVRGVPDGGAPGLRVVGDGVPLGETVDVLGVGELLAVGDDDEELVSIGIRMSAPTATNIAAMAILDSRIVSSGES